MMENITDVLNQSFVFRTHEKEEARKLETVFDEWEIRSGEILTTAGEPVQDFLKQTAAFAKNIEDASLLEHY